LFKAATSAASAILSLFRSPVAAVAKGEKTAQPSSEFWKLLHCSSDG